MNVSGDEVRTATRAAAEVITPGDVPPLRLNESPARRRATRRTRMTWFAPLAAAAAVVVLVVGSATAGSWFGRSGHSPTVAPATAATGSYAGVPAYYVALGNPSLAMVRATATGKTLARITTHVPFVGVTGAADDRTFVIDAQRQVMGPVVLWPDQPAFYLLKLTASGAEASYKRLAIPPLPKGFAVTGLALSPDGSKLAVAMDTDPNNGLGVLEIRIYTLATGAVRTWSMKESGDSEDSGGFTGSGTDGSESISWTTDGRTLAFDWRNRYTIGVRLLNTTASGDNLSADSRLAVTVMNLSSGRPPAFQCETDAIISGNGAAILCGYTSTVTHSSTSYTTTTQYVQFSTATGKQTGLLSASPFQGRANDSISLFWVNSTGTAAVGDALTPAGSQVGIINGQHFTPLPGVKGLTIAAW
jgi:hypothetical protein